MDETLYNLDVVDRPTFIQFLALLHQDYLANNEGWENVTLASFLEAMTAYAIDIQGYYDNTNQNIDANTPTWKVFADILKGAKIYE
jgi:hypothetical protein